MDGSKERFLGHSETISNVLDRVSEKEIEFINIVLI